MADAPDDLATGDVTWWTGGGWSRETAISLARFGNHTDVVNLLRGVGRAQKAASAATDGFGF